MTGIDHRAEAERLLAEAGALHRPDGTLASLASATAINLLNQRANVHALLHLADEAGDLSRNQELGAVVGAASSIHGLIDAEDLRAASDYVRHRIGEIVHHGTPPADRPTAQYRAPSPPPGGWPGARGSGIAGGGAA